MKTGTFKAQESVVPQQSFAEKANERTKASALFGRGPP